MTATTGDDGVGTERSVAFLRGINLGGRRVKKDQLIAIVAGCGLDGVDTFLASGNVLFTWADWAAKSAADRAGLERRLSDALQADLGYAVPVTIRTPDQLRAIAAAAPFDDAAIAAATGKPQVMLAFDPLAEGTVDAVLALATDDDRLAHEAGELFWLPGGGVGRSELDPGAVARALGGTVLTVRTLNTITRLVARLRAPA
jgi:uncharacterized protein (DUF1697 family)